MLDNDLAGIVMTFSATIPGFPVHNWKLNTGSLSAHQNGLTTNYDIANSRVQTTFDAAKFTNATDLAVIRTFIHEAVHAYLVSYFRDDSINAQKDYKDLVEAWAIAQKPNLNNIPHYVFVNNFVINIGLALIEYGKAKGYTFPSNLERDRYYHDLAWGGLTGTSAFQSLSVTDRNRILDEIEAEQFGIDKNGNPKMPKGGATGC